ncbi:MAG: nucleoside monophosphate kinase [Oscillochloris sp.]|nr:nucleoside monophosphate kinase [Oscillochloris sp.]
MAKALNIVFIGPPGSGKSTIAANLVERIPLTVIASGQRLRTEIAAGSPIGREIGPLLDQGHFAPDRLMDRLMRNWLSEVPDENGVLLDGYPRSPKQALALTGILADLRRPLNAVIALELNADEAIRRLSGRRICVGGGDKFTLHIDDDEAVARCKASGGTLAQRDDDKPEVIKERMRVYSVETEPVLDFYAESKLLHHIDANGSPDEVTKRVLNVLQIRS